MGSFGKERFLTWGAIIALAVVLGVLGRLQYRWSGEVSQAASSRMQQNLQTSMLQFRQALINELASICSDLEPAIRSSGNPDAHSYAAQWQHWETTSSHPSLVSGIFIWHSDPGSRSELLRLDAAQEKFSPVSPPAEVSPLLSRLREAPPRMLRPGPKPLPPGSLGRYFDSGPGSSGLSGRRAGPNQVFFEFFPHWVIDQDVPAFVLPITDRQQFAATPPSEWVIIQLDRGVLQKDIFPELVAQFFGSGEALNYQVAIRAVTAQREDSSILYASDRTFADASIASADAVMHLWAPGPPTSDRGRGASFFGPGPRPSHGIANFPARDWRRNANGFPSKFEVLRYGSPGGDWELMARHRSGSLEEAVAELRRRNLAISFGILGVMAATAGLIVVAMQRARRLAEMQMRFVAGVSHELRTPLAVISSAADNIAEGVVNNERQLSRYAHAIRNQAKQLSNLIEQVLLFAATRQLKREPATEFVEVSELIEAALQSTAESIASANCRVETRIDRMLPCVKVNSSAVQQCLQNLITNAVKYGGPARWLGVSASLASRREVAITVSDRGPGIPAKDLPHIFEPFYRGEAAHNAQVHGTGIGLAIARAMAEETGGRLTVTTSGAGTSFTLRLPAVESAPEAAAVPSLPQPAGESRE